MKHLEFSSKVKGFESLDSALVVQMRLELAIFVSSTKKRA